MVVGVVAIVAIVGVIGAGVLLRSPSPRPAAAPAAAVTMGGDAKGATPAPIAAPEPPAPTAPTVTPSATVDTGAAAAEIELTIDADPKVVDVYQGATKIGASSGPIKLKRADGRVKLTFKAVGYTPQDIEVPASANTVVSVKLKKVANARRGDLEF
jgi:hypothetical protein